MHSSTAELRANVARLPWQTLASLAIALLGGAFSVWTVLDRGWMPHDEGTLGLSAEGVMRGELPHRDFSDPYSGGLSYWHALAMRGFGLSFMSPRYALFLAFLLWLPAIWWLAKRSVGNWWALGVTLTAAWWSLPLYPAAMPTWYLLFFATWVVATLERWHATRLLRWLALTGVLCGMAVAVKQTGLYSLAGALLGVLFIDQESARLRWPDGTPRGRTDPIIVALIVLLGALVLTLLWGHLGSGEVLHLVLPIGFLLALAILREWRLTNAEAPRWTALLRHVGIIAAATVVPVALLLLPYWQVDGLYDLYAGVVEAGVSRISELRLVMRSADTLMRFVWPVYLLLGVAVFAVRSRALRLIALAGTAVLLLFACVYRTEYLRVWLFSTSLLPLTSGAILVAGVRAWRAHRALDPVLLALASIMTLHALNQFPFSSPVYFGFVAPLVVVTAAATAAHFGALSRLRPGFFLLAGFGLYLRFGSLFTLGNLPAIVNYSHRLALPRGGLAIGIGDSVRYTRALELVAQHRGNGTVYAGPELPEIYFLAGVKPPGLDSYSLFARAVRDSAQLAGTFNLDAANVIVINRASEYGLSLRPDVSAWLEHRYPSSEQFGKLEVRWR